MFKMPKFEFDSVLGTATIDGKRIDSVTDVNINAKGGNSHATVTLTFDADVEVKGDVLILPHGTRRKSTLEKLLKEYE